jgi:hypothetical protein
VRTKHLLMRVGAVAVAAVAAMAVSGASASAPTGSSSAPPGQDQVGFRVPIPKPGNYTLRRVVTSVEPLVRSQGLSELTGDIRAQVLDDRIAVAIGVSPTAKEGEYAALLLVALLASDALPKGHPKLVDIKLPVSNAQGKPVRALVRGSQTLPNVLKPSANAVARPRAHRVVCKEWSYRPVPRQREPVH